MRTPLEIVSATAAARGVCKGSARSSEVGQIVTVEHVDRSSGVGAFAGGGSQDVQQDVARHSGQRHVTLGIILSAMLRLRLRLRRWRWRWR